MTMNFLGTSFLPLKILFHLEITQPWAKAYIDACIFQFHSEDPLNWFDSLNRESLYHSSLEFWNFIVVIVFLLFTSYLKQCNSWASYRTEVQIKHHSWKRTKWVIAVPFTFCFLSSLNKVDSSCINIKV